MNNNSSKPFSKDYVIKTTVKHMRKSIDISIRKTSERIGELSEDSAKSQEVFKTLGELYALRKRVDELVIENPGNKASQ